MVVGVIAFPDDRHLIAARRQMPVDAVGRHIERAVLIPFNRYIARRIAGVLDLGIRGHPVKTLALLAPKSIRIADALRVHFKIFVIIDKGFCSPIHPALRKLCCPT